MANMSMLLRYHREWTFSRNLVLDLHDQVLFFDFFTASVGVSSKNVIIKFQFAFFISDVNFDNEKSFRFLRKNKTSNAVQFF